jgi:hypothetical protein
VKRPAAGLAACWPEPEAECWVARWLTYCQKIAFYVQDGRKVSSLTQAEARAELAALGPLLGRPSHFVTALRRQVRFRDPVLIHILSHVVKAVPGPLLGRASHFVTALRRQVRLRHSNRPDLREAPRLGTWLLHCSPLTPQRACRRRAQFCTAAIPTCRCSARVPAQFVQLSALRPRLTPCWCTCQQRQSRQPPCLVA